MGNPFQRAFAFIVTKVTSIFSRTSGAEGSTRGACRGGHEERWLAMVKTSATAESEDYLTVKQLAYLRQDRIIAALQKAGIDPWDEITKLAFCYHVAQSVGKAEAEKLRAAKNVGVM